MVKEGVSEERPQQLKMNGFWGGGLSHLADWVTASQKPAHTIASNMDVIKKKPTTGPESGRSVQNPRADSVGEHNDGMSASRIEWRLTLHPKIPIWDNNICQGKGFTGLWQIMRAGRSKYAVTPNQRSDTKTVSKEEFCSVIILYYDTIVLSVVELNMDVTGKKMQPCCGEETPQKWGKESTCWPKREWSKWSKQLPTGDNNFKEARHFTWHFNLPTSARIINCFDLLLCWPLFYQPASGSLDPSCIWYVNGLFVYVLHNADSPLGIKQRQLFHSWFHCPTVRREFKVKFIFCSQIDSKMPVGESKDSFIPLLLLHLPPAHVTPPLSTQFYPADPPLWLAWPAAVRPTCSAVSGTVDERRFFARI